MGGNPTGNASFSLMEETQIIALHKAHTLQLGKINPTDNYELKKPHRKSPPPFWDPHV